MSVSLNATITVQDSPLHVGHPVWVGYTVTNQTPSPVTVVNPDVGKPPEEIGWSFTQETYQISVLLFFHLIAISITDASGEKLPLVGPNPWVTPILLPRLPLNPGDAFTLRINLSDHFQLEQAGEYHLSIDYGDDQTSASAATKLVIL